jgi:hypothetical protein
MAYEFYYDLDVFPKFTYFLTDTNRGDQFEQKDKRWVGGLDARHIIFSHGLAARWKITTAIMRIIKLRPNCRFRPILLVEVHHPNQAQGGLLSSPGSMGGMPGHLRGTGFVDEETGSARGSLSQALNGEGS